MSSPNRNLSIALLLYVTFKKKSRAFKKFFKNQRRIYIEIEDDEGKPIRVNDKFKENHPNMDVSSKDVDLIKNTVLNHSKVSQENRRQMAKFRKK